MQLLKVWTFRIQMVTLAQELGEHVHQGGTVLRAPVSHCHVHQGPTLTGWFVKILDNIEIPTEQVSSSRFPYNGVYMYVCVSMVVVFIWQTPLAVVHVHPDTSVALRASLVHLDCVRQVSTVRVETQQLQVRYWLLFFLNFLNLLFFHTYWFSCICVSGGSLTVFKYHEIVKSRTNI